MPVTFKVASHPAEPVESKSIAVYKEVEDFVQKTWGTDRPVRGKKKVKEVLQSSFSVSKEPAVDLTSVLSRSNGFVDTVIDAYNRHHHLSLRPDDVWMAILNQFNFYVNAHSEELRSSFVQHAGKKELIVVADGNRHTVSFGEVAKQMTAKIDDKVVDKSLKDWILPNFTTTTDNDTVICAVLMMSTFKSYFNFKMKLACGLPSVSLLGEKSDWELLSTRLEKLGTFGDEPAAFAMQLKPILNRFIEAFTRAENDSVQDIEFWGRICHYTSGGSGPSYLSGWVTAFCAWDEKGKWLGPKIRAVAESEGPYSVTFEPINIPGGLARRRLEALPGLTLDGIPYGFIDGDDISPGYCEVDVKLDDNGEEMDCVMVSGLMGSVIEGEKKDTLRPLPAWFMFVTKLLTENEVEMLRRRV
ncbi:hypothetical protein CPB83DRAFT_818495 [Crepidotus variabilis]|uniref:Uncharacterized protein n=1 Tax=Crepidotus variabilis TaxID=179855 RepID=A0A9P6EAY5_9AGAR|nr:hypothetical protein CPB83DRAFT_818495 [Crepidotus variabilis]